MNLKSMKVEAKKEMQTPMMMDMDGPEYPYGLRLDLNTEVLKKLEISEMPKVGSKLKIFAIVEVCAVSKSEHRNGEPCMNVGLQITDMALDAKPQMNQEEAAEKLYGKKEETNQNNFQQA